ncbi:hypothetical protein Gasu2_52800 [Galdieria sulphuraria]|uniref:Uncharacterized protein n=1 Tax=Galdieria sulphuraria TaxID=130081 RepID=M2XTP6_GALSU|nr:uncharacterized protein Gasu_53740 [Galdieria sulphuraria]EME27038.1 hypothetical protein Gasu_53740 [Galdieria sulphuraria]GJD11134.1 hypothetical protein Gasu2_52800 [Galdieria sulphuraria]|eukprot:XP_005703558.1 hypothetical protein Gasu_53740 [Galdieria sulphuraria]
MYHRGLWCCCWHPCYKLFSGSKATVDISSLSWPCSHLGPFLQTIHSRSTQAPVSASLEWDDKHQDQLERREPTSQPNSSLTTNGLSHSYLPPYQRPQGDPSLWNADSLVVREEQNGVHGANHFNSSSYSDANHCEYQETAEASLSSINGAHQTSYTSHETMTTQSISYHNNNSNNNNTISISLSTSHSDSSQSVLSALNHKFRGQQPESSDLAKFIAHESGKYYDLSKSYRHIRQENAYVHAFLKTRIDCPNTTVILPETVGKDRVFRFKERNVANLFDTKAVVNRESSLRGNVSDSSQLSSSSYHSNGTSSSVSHSGTTGNNASGNGRKKNPPGRLVTQRILEEEADQKEKVQKEFEEKVRDVLKRKGKFSLDEETAKQLIKEYSSKKLASRQSTSKGSTMEESKKVKQSSDEEEQLYPQEIPKNKKEDSLELNALDELRARLKQVEKKPNFTNLVDISQLVKVFPQDHWSAEQVNRLALFIQQTHGLSATTRMERLTKFIHQLNEEVRKSQEQKPLLETKRSRGRKPFQGSNNNKKQTTSANRKQGKK